jgi:hypothetical protein
MRTVVEADDLSTVVPAAFGPHARLRHVERLRGVG